MAEYESRPFTWTSKEEKGCLKGMESTKGMRMKDVDEDEEASARGLTINNFLGGSVQACTIRD